MAICWPPSATGPSRAATPVAVSGTTPSAIVRTDSWCPSRSSAVTSARPGFRGLTRARREAAAHSAGHQVGRPSRARRAAGGPPGRQPGHRRGRGGGQENRQPGRHVQRGGGDGQGAEGCSAQVTDDGGVGEAVGGFGGDRAERGQRERGDAPVQVPVGVGPRGTARADRHAVSAARPRAECQWSFFATA